MFLPNTTTHWQARTANPLNAMENRRVFASLDVAKNVGEFYGKVGSFGKNAANVVSTVVKPIIGPLRILMFPFTAPTQIALWSVGKAYTWGVKPAAKATRVTAGTIMEMGAGLKEATYDPALTLAKAPLRNLKMNMLDLPIHILKSAVKLPMEFVRTPGRILSEIKKATLEFPGKVGGFIKNTRDNLTKVLDNVGQLKPIEATKSLIKTVRDAAVGALVNPVVGTLQHAWAPMAPLMAMPLGAGSILYESKKQYFTSIAEAGGQFRNGVKRMIDAPGKELDTHGIKQWWKEVSPEEKKEVSHAQDAAHAEPKASGNPHAEPKAPKAEPKHAEEHHEEHPGEKGGGHH